MSSTPDNSNSTSKNDAYLTKVTVGNRKVHNAPITLSEYDPRWPKLFEQEARRIQSVLRNKALQVGHVGSTSVPELCAKPIIDILLVVTDSSDEESYISSLEEAGYTLHIREPEWFEHRLFKGLDKDVNLHVFSKGASEIDRMLQFRDRLRSNNTDRDEYARVKHNLAQRKWRHVQDYADAKNSIVQEIMERANAVD
ncbi:GrpB family protein [Virgibacillus salidurans]|uniref:GrpB family protein n=1 Tax=Virgibacillus salidurans TaxID=2831673 RepID=UPI001F198747|nr:GrpB family protein [Virgibacillus sp. NKC19-16]